MDADGEYLDRGIEQATHQGMRALRLGLSGDLDGGWAVFAEVDPDFVVAVLLTMIDAARRVCGLHTIAGVSLVQPLFDDECGGAVSAEEVEDPGERIAGQMIAARLNHDRDTFVALEHAAGRTLQLWNHVCAQVYAMTVQLIAAHLNGERVFWEIDINGNAL